MLLCIVNSCKTKYLLRGKKYRLHILYNLIRTVSRMDYQPKTIIVRISLVSELSTPFYNLHTLILRGFCLPMIN
nr:MAG TPA: hypothetical protein [Bacteriophage sp.]